MAPRSTKAANGDGKNEEAANSGKVPASRRSARLAGDAAPTVAEGDDTKKRPASNAAARATASKKVKPVSATKTDKKATASNGKAKAQPKSMAKAVETIEEEKEEGQPVKEDAEAVKADERPKEGEEEKEKAEEEKEEEAPASAEPEGKGLEIGDKLPKLSLKDEESNGVDVSELAGEKGVVIFLYPKADTPGCTNQACGFQDAFNDITAFGYEIYGLSKDKPDAQKKWKGKRKLNYHLLSDPESKLIKRLGAFVRPNNTKRSHFIFEKGTGKLVDIDIGVKPVTDPSNCLKFLQKHHK